MSQTLAGKFVDSVAALEDSRAEKAYEPIRDALRGLRFGTVSVIVQDGVIVQVERTEKLRLQKREHMT